MIERSLSLAELRGTWLHFDYIDLDEAEILRCVPCGDGHVYVLYMRGWATYEFVIQDSDGLRWSNCGYGMSDACLRDGLIVACGDHPGDRAHDRLLGPVAYRHVAGIGGRTCAWC